MTKGRVSIIIPARVERRLQVTIDDLLVKAAGDIEIIAVLDGYSPEPAIRTDRRLRFIHKPEPEGMRPAINDAAAMASGEYLMKCDGHCMFDLGYDEVLKADCAEDWLVVPTRHSIDPKTWTVRPRDWNYSYLTFPYDKRGYVYGMHAVTPDKHSNRAINAARAEIAIDDLMTFQGSCWFQHTANFHRLGPLDHKHYDFYQEAQEIGLRQWMTGGCCKINKRTWYAHLHKGHDEPREFYLSVRRKRKSEMHAVDFWTGDKWPGATRTFAEFIEIFWPVDGWPEDWQDPKYRGAFLNRPAEEIPAHT